MRRVQSSLHLFWYWDLTPASEPRRLSFPSSKLMITVGPASKIPVRAKSLGGGVHCRGWRPTSSAFYSQKMEARGKPTQVHAPSRPCFGVRDPRTPHPVCPPGGLPASPWVGHSICHLVGCKGPPSVHTCPRGPARSPRIPGIALDSQLQAPSRDLERPCGRGGARVPRGQRASVAWGAVDEPGPPGGNGEAVPL